MDARVRFELEETAGGWTWRLVDNGAVVGVGRQVHDSAAAASDAVTTVRAAAAALEAEAIAFEGAPPDVSHVVSGPQHHYEWTLLVGDDPVASPPFTYPSRGKAADAGRRFRRSALGSTVVVGAVDSVDAVDGRPETPEAATDEDEDGTDPETAAVDSVADAFRERVPFSVGSASLRESVAGLGGLLVRGPRHRRALERIPTRIAVSGIRGKSSTALRLDDILSRRGYATLTKITGNYPHLRYEDDVVPLDRRGSRTMLYENARIVDEYIPKLVDAGAGDGNAALVVENQGITEYTTRLVNQTFVRPHIVVLTNVRGDHLDTLGGSRRDLARAFARSVPAGSHVVSGEQHPVIHEYLGRELDRVGATLSRVDIPARHADSIAAETIYALDAVLERIGLDPLADAEREAYLDAAQPRWLSLPGGRVFNAAEVNDVESTEAIRRALGGDEVITPFVFLRADRRGRTASFADYVDLLTDRGLVERVHVAGAYARAFAAGVAVDTERHAVDVDPAALLDELLADGHPVMLMGNTVDEFMRGFERELTRRTRQAALAVDTA